MKNGFIKSCGCIKREMLTKHGLHGTRIERIWDNMKMRCSNPSDTSFKHYGGRGIRVCEEWKELKNFADWSFGNGYADNLELDRKDNNGNYEPNNCRWITHKEQQYNKRTNRLLEFNGVTLPLNTWSQKVGIDYRTLTHRLNYGWSIERALTESVHRKSTALESK